jgi:ribonuclease VapC
MTVLDASIIVGILAREADFDDLMLQLGAAEGPFTVSPVSVLEAALSLSRAKAEKEGVRRTPKMVHDAHLSVMTLLNSLHAVQTPVTADVTEGAVDAAARYGKAVGHPAQLNLGDCFSYAAARAAGAPLLYKGNDFAQTDLA